MKKSLISAIAVLAIVQSLGDPLHAGTNTVDRDAEEAKKIAVAKVNGTEINLFMLTRAMNRVAPKYVKGGEQATLETSRKIKGEALDRLIFEELAVQEAISQGVNTEPEAVDRVINEVRKNMGTEQAYKDYLEKSDLTEHGLKQLITRSQRIELITAKEVYGKVQVDEKLLREEFEKEKAIYIIPEKIVVEDIWFIKGKDDATSRHAGEILDLLRRKNNDIGKLVPDGTFISRNIILKKEKYPDIYKVASKMNNGEVSGVIDEKDGFHIIKLSKKEALRQATFEDARPTIEPKFLYPAQEQRRQEWEKELRKKAKIEILTDTDQFITNERNTGEKK